MIRVLLWHQSNLVCNALATAIAQEDDIAVVTGPVDATALVDLAVREKPHVAVVDHTLGGTSPVTEVCRRFIDVLPELRLLVLLDRRSCQRVGVDLMKLVPWVGLMDTSASLGELVRSIRRLVHGQPVIDPDLAVAALKATHNPLTNREREVLRLAVRGEPVADIAAGLFLSTGTVRNYLSRITAKTGARTRLEAIRIAETAGWI